MPWGHRLRYLDCLIVSLFFISAMEYSARPSTSSCPAGELTAPVTQTADLDDTFPIDLPPNSQLDSSVLEALPQAMKNKILSSYAKLEKDSPTTLPSCESSADSAKGSSVLRSPARLSPNRRGRRGERGKGRGSSLHRRQISGTAASNASPERQKLLTELTEPTPRPCVLAESISVENGTEQKQSLPTAAVKDEDSGSVKSQDSDDILLIEDHAQFCVHFREYLKEWVEMSVSGPLEEDLEKVVSYFIKLCRHNLEFNFYFKKAASVTWMTYW